jgi:hypothetical protein
MEFVGLVWLPEKGETAAGAADDVDAKERVQVAARSIPAKAVRCPPELVGMRTLSESCKRRRASKPLWNWF